MKTEKQWQWLRKEPAAVRLKMSVRGLLALAAAGKIRRKSELDAATNQKVTVFHEGDIERVSYERQHPDERTSTEVVQGRQGSGMHTPPAVPKQDAVAVILAHLAAQLPAVQAPRWMTLQQAADYTGLPVGTLVTAIRAGRIPFEKAQPLKVEGQQRAKPRASWRISRAILDAYRGADYAAHDAQPGGVRLGAGA